MKLEKESDFGLNRHQQLYNGLLAEIDITRQPESRLIMAKVALGEFARVHEAYNKLILAGLAEGLDVSKTEKGAEVFGIELAIKVEYGIANSWSMPKRVTEA